MNRCLSPLVWLTVTLMALLSAACTDSDTVPYSHFEQVGSDGWDPLDILVFEPWPADSAAAAGSVYRMDLVMRYSSRFRTADLPLALTIEDENGIVRADTIVIKPADSKNVETRQRYGVREMRMTLDPQLRLHDGFAVTVSPLAAREQTKGMLNVGIILTDSHAPLRRSPVRF